MEAQGFAIRPFIPDDIPSLARIWNSVVEDGIAFPQMDMLDEESALSFFSSQTLTAVAIVDGNIAGLYILHPNNIGRVGHICNSSYAVDKAFRGKGIGRKLVQDSLEKGKQYGFRIMQFNAVVRTNTSARALYESIGFKPLGIIPEGFLMKDGHYEDIIPYYFPLV